MAEHGIIYRLNPYSRDKGGETFHVGWNNQEHQVFEKT